MCLYRRSHRSSPVACHVEATKQRTVGSARMRVVGLRQAVDKADIRAEATRLPQRRLRRKRSVSIQYNIRNAWGPRGVTELKSRMRKIETTPISRGAKQRPNRSNHSLVATGILPSQRLHQGTALVITVADEASESNYTGSVVRAMMEGTRSDAAVVC